MMRLTDKHVVVTGGAGSIGLAAARLFHSEGARIVLVDRDADGLARAAAHFPAESVLTVVADVSESRDVANYVARATERFGPIDVLFSNAGNDGPIMPVTEYPEDMFDLIYRVHVRGTFLACRHALPAMRDHGSIVITSSVVGVMGVPGNCAYVAAKHALIGLARSIAKDVASRGIRVNTVNPGPVDNAFMRAAEQQMTARTGHDAGAMFDSIIPLGRHVTPEEVAKAALFLASDESSFTTGATLLVDGGMSA